MKRSGWLALVWLFAGSAFAHAGHDEPDTASAAQRASAPFLWQISDGKHHHYLLGSVHLLPQAAHPLPAALEAAYAKADALVFESDLDALDDPQTQKSVLAAAQQSRLADEADAALLQRVHSAATASGLPADVCDPYTAWFCALTLELVGYERGGFESAFGIDQYFHQRARGDRKTIAWFETPATHLQLFSAMHGATGIELLRSALDEQQQDEQAPQALFKAWQRGDEAFVEQLVNDTRRDYPRVYAALLVDRNKAWLPALNTRLRQPRPQLIIVGAAHLYGRDGLIALLRARGFEVRKP